MPGAEFRAEISPYFWVFPALTSANAKTPVRNAKIRRCYNPRINETMDAQHERPFGTPQASARHTQLIPTRDSERGHARDAILTASVTRAGEKTTGHSGTRPRVSAGRMAKVTKDHKRPFAQSLISNQRFLCNLRYTLAGDLAGAWALWGHCVPSQAYRNCVIPGRNRA